MLLITGLPCTGKTTLARRLAAELGLPLLCKDEIKERLFETLGWSDRAWSRRLGAATYEVMYYAISAMLAGGVSLAVESNFPPQSAGERLAKLQAQTPFRLGVVECIARAEVVKERWRQRVERRARHPGHNDAAALEEFFNLVDQHTDAAGYARLGAPPLAAQVWEVDTTRTPSYETLLAQLRQQLG